MAERTNARDVMTAQFRRIDERLTVRAAILLLLSGEERSRILVAVDDEDAPTGLLTARLLLRGLLGEWAHHSAIPRDDAQAADLQRSLQGILRERLEDPVRHVLARDVPSAAPGVGIARLMELASEGRRECFPVVEEGRLVGIVRSADVFRAAAALALSPRTGGGAPGSGGA